MKVFKEEQRFTQTWLIILLSISTLIPIGVIIKELSEGKKEYSLINIIPIILLTMLPFGIVFILKLQTKINEIGIHYQFFPFHFSMKTITWSEINSAKVRTYYPISEFGGWGLRGGFFFNKGKGRAINVSGDIGIQLVLKNGEKLLIGTQKKTEAINVLKTYENKIT